jgi:hypothetical protein
MGLESQSYKREYILTYCYNVIIKIIKKIKFLFKVIDSMHFSTKYFVLLNHPKAHVICITLYVQFINACTCFRDLVLFLGSSHKVV